MNFCLAKPTNNRLLDVNFSSYDIVEMLFNLNSNLAHDRKNSVH